MFALWHALPLARRRACQAVLAVPATAALIAVGVGWLSATYAFGLTAAGLSTAMLAFSILAHPHKGERQRHVEERSDPDDEGGQRSDAPTPVRPDAPGGGGAIDWGGFERELAAYTIERELAVAA